MKNAFGNLFFDPEFWKDIRKRGVFKFVSLQVALSLPLAYLLFSLETKGDVVVSVFYMIATCIAIFIVRISTWYWMEYKYNRFLNNIRKYDLKDFIFLLLNGARLLVVLGFSIIFVKIILNQM